MEASKSYKRGETIFMAGEKGGDLMFIEAGEVEIFQDQAGQLVTLSVMKKGEVIGVMTCLNDGPRLASAKARSDVKIKHIPHQNIKAVVAKLPAWMNIVLKEFTVRLQSMNKAYSESVLRIRALEDNQISNIYTATQMLGAMPVLAKYIARTAHEETFLVIEDLYSVLEMVLGVPKENLDVIFNIFMSTGLAKVEIQPDTKSIIMKSASFGTLRSFHAFLLDAKGAKGRRLASMTFSAKESRSILAVAKIAKSLYADSVQQVEVTFETLKESMEQKTGVSFDADALKTAHQQKILKVVGNADDGKVVLVPSQVETLVRHLEAYKKLRLLDEPKNEQAAL